MSDTYLELLRVRKFIVFCWWFPKFFSEVIDQFAYKMTSYNVKCILQVVSNFCFLLKAIFTNTIHCFSSRVLLLSDVILFPRYIIHLHALVTLVNFVMQSKLCKLFNMKKATFFNHYLFQSLPFSITSFFLYIDLGVFSISSRQRRI